MNIMVNTKRCKYCKQIMEIEIIGIRKDILFLINRCNSCEREVDEILRIIEI